MKYLLNLLFIILKNQVRFWHRIVVECLAQILSTLKEHCTFTAQIFQMHITFLVFYDILKSNLDSLYKRLFLRKNIAILKSYCLVATIMKLFQCYQQPCFLGAEVEKLEYR